MTHKPGSPQGAGIDAYKFTTVRERLHAQNGEVLDFALGADRMETPAYVRALAQEQPDLALRAATRDEIAAFAEDASAMLARNYGAQVRPEDILITPGGRPAMAAMLAALVQPDETVLVTEPSYPAFANLAKLRGASVRVARLNPDAGFAPDFNGLDAETLGWTRLVGLNYPNNPSGAVASESLCDALTAKLPSDAVVFNDCIYAPLQYEGQATSFLSIASNLQRLELHSLTKLFALGPLGSAFLAGPEDLVAAVRKVSDYFWTPMSGLHLAAAQRCVNDAEHFAHQRDHFGARVTRLHSVLAKTGLRAYPTPAGLYVLCATPTHIGDSAVAGAEAACSLLLERFGLACVAWEDPKGGYLRFSAMYRDEDLERFGDLSATIAASYDAK